MTTALTALQPTNIESAIRLADMMSNSTLVPTPLQKKPADCLLVIEQAIRWGMSPFAVAQCASVIKGKLMYEGKLVAAVINANGDLEKRLSYEYSGEGENRAITVSGTVRGEKEPRTIAIVVKDVKTDNDFWRKQPDQQLMYSGARVWARRHMPELMLGVYTPDEDIEDTKPSLESAVTIESPVKVDEPVHGQTAPYTLTIEKDDWMKFGKEFSDSIKSSKNLDELDSWIVRNDDNLIDMKERAPQLFARVGSNIEEKRRKFG